MTHHDTAPRLLGALGAELYKARTFPLIPRTLLLGGTTVLVATVFIIVQTSQLASSGRADALGGHTPADMLGLVLHYSQVFPILLGAWVVGQDVPSGPCRSALLASPGRASQVTAKLLTAALTAMLAGVVCVGIVILPLAAGSTASQEVLSLRPYAWLISYWVVIAVMAAALVAATRSAALGAVPLLVWAIGLSDLLTVRVPALAGAADQVFKSAYLQGGVTPSSELLCWAGAQVAAAVALGIGAYVHRDVG